MVVEHTRAVLSVEPPATLRPITPPGLGRVALYQSQAGSPRQDLSGRSANHTLLLVGANYFYDLVLSSGFLAFAGHSGFLASVEEVYRGPQAVVLPMHADDPYAAHPQAGLRVAGIMGTSAGALAGSLYCAGYSPRQVAEELSRDPPIKLLTPSLAPWRGGFLSLEPVVERLRELLPATFEELDREFAVGVVDSHGRHMLIDSGPLPEAVAASAAIPLLFEGVSIPGRGRRNLFKDGGVVDRVGLKAWRDRRRSQLAAAGRQHEGGRLPPCLVHVIQRSSPFSGLDDVGAAGEANVTVVHSPKSGVSFFSLGDFEEDMMQASKRARPQVDLLKNAAKSAKLAERRLTLLKGS